MSITKKKYFIMIGLSLLVFGFSIVRPVNIDEGYYIASSQEVSEGKVLYRDFIFHQMPLTIYVYSVFSNFGFWSLVFGRALSVLMISLSGLLLLSLVKKLSGNNTIFIFLILFFLNSFLIDWSVLIRIYALSIFLLSLGVFCFSKFLENEYNSTYMFLSAFAFSLLVYTKISFIACYLMFMLFMLLAIIKYDKRNLYKFFFITFLASAIPALIFWLIFGKYSEEFYFNVFSINFITKKYIDAPFSLSLLKYFGFFLLPQNLILLLIVLFSGFKYTFFEKFLIFNILCFALIHIPSRMLMEYFSSITPLLILLSCLRYQKFVDKVIAKYRILSAKHIYVSLLILYIISAPFSVTHFKNIIQGSELLMNPIQLYYFEQTVNSLKGNTVLSSWEGYSIFSDKSPLLKEQYGAAFINRYADGTDILKYNIAQQQDYEDLVLSKTPDVIIYDNSNSAHLDTLKDLICKNYNKAFEYKSVEVFTK